MKIKKVFIIITNKKLNMRFLAFDTETTGLNKNKCEILTAFFIILDEEFRIIDTLDLKIKHGFYTVYPKALEVNKIDILQHHNDKKSIYMREANRKLKTFLLDNKGNEKYIPIGHNINFDIDMIKSNELLDDLFFSKNISHHIIDTMTVGNFLKASKILPHELSLSLISLCNFLKLEDNVSQLAAHNAEYDIKMTIKLFKKFQEMVGKDEVLSLKEYKQEDNGNDSDNKDKYKKRKRN